MSKRLLEVALQLHALPISLDTWIEEGEKQIEGVEGGYYWRSLSGEIERYDQQVADLAPAMRSASWAKIAALWEEHHDLAKRYKEIVAFDEDHQRMMLEGPPPSLRQRAAELKESADSLVKRTTPYGEFAFQDMLRRTGRAPKRRWFRKP